MKLAPILPLFFLTGCIQEIALFDQTSEFLVIDAHLDNLQGRKVVWVYFAQAYNLLPDYSRTKNSTVAVVDSEGNKFDFTYRSHGVFINDSFIPIIGRAYKVRVKLENDTDYESEYDTLFQVAPIERIWFEHDQGINQLNFYIDFYDENLTTDYYRWRYKNTYEFVAPEALAKSLTNERMETSNCIQWETTLPPLASTVARCWIDVYDHQYLKVDNDRLFDGQHVKSFYLFSVPLNRNFDRGFHVSVRQLSLSNGAFNYWSSIEDQINNNGTIFEKTNFQIKGNIRSLTNADEVVLGYFSVSAAEQKSIFVDKYIGLWGDLECIADPCKPALCYDCRKAGASITNVKPEFWPH